MRRPSLRRAIAACTSLALLPACGGDDHPIAVEPPPTIAAAAVSANPHNVISALAAVRVTGADSVALRYRLDVSGSAVATTPAVTLANDTATVPVLGLLPERRYELRVVAWGAGGVTVDETIMTFTTGALPADLPQYVATGSEALPGFVVFSAGQYGLVIDNTGRVVWYRHFAATPGLNFAAQPNGRYVARPPGPADVVAPFVELDRTGAVTRTFACARGLNVRFHDVLVEADGGYWIMCDETRAMDLSAVGGRADALVDGTAVQHIGPTGTLLFEWSPFDHFQVTDLDPSQRTGARVNWMHGNAIDRDAEGNLLLSFRSLNEVTKVNATTGAVMWRMGGLRNEFTFQGLPGAGFARQHGLRATPDGFMLLDNTGDPAESRAEHYTVDAAARRATLVRSYGAVPAVVTQIGGSVQPLAGGRTLVTFGTEGRVEEYDATGRRLWHISGNPGYVFRAQRIASLYAPGAGDTR